MSLLDDYIKTLEGVEYRSVLDGWPEELRHLSSVIRHRAMYQFPATRFVSNSPWRQWWHLLSEVIEIGRALLRGDLQHAAAEAWDVKQSAETLQRILAGKGADVEMAREEVESGCRERGYYEVPDRAD